MEKPERAGGRPFTRQMTAKKEFTVVKRWTAAEEAALKAGIRKYGAGAWVRIRDDKEFGHFLSRRTGMQLKDKWRNLLKFGHITEAEGRRPAGATPCPSCGTVALPGADGRCGACGAMYGSTSSKGADTFLSAAAVAAAAATVGVGAPLPATQRAAADGGSAVPGAAPKRRSGGSRVNAAAALRAGALPSVPAVKPRTFEAGAKLMVEDRVHSNVWWQGQVVKQEGSDVWLTYPGWDAGTQERVDASSSRLWSVPASGRGAGNKKAWRHLGGGAWSVRSRERGERRPPAEALAGPSPPAHGPGGARLGAGMDGLRQRSMTPDSGANEVPFGAKRASSGSTGTPNGHLEWCTRSEADTATCGSHGDTEMTTEEHEEAVSYADVADLVLAAGGSIQAAARAHGCAAAALASPATPCRPARLAGVLPAPPLEACGADAW
eukprot:PRCOL_00002542-RA